MISAVSNGARVRSIHRVADPFEFHWFEAGPDDAPAIVLVHGFMAHAMAFRRVLPELARRYRLVVPDLAGHGLDRSYRSAGVAPTLTSLERWFGHFLSSVDGEFHLVGHSLGARLCYRAAAQSRWPIRSLTLVAPGLRVPPSSVGSYALRRLPGSLATLAANRVGLAFYSPLNWRGEPMDDIEAQAYLSPLRDAARARFMLQLGADLLAPAPPAVVTPVEMPTQVVWGELDHLFPVEDAYWLADRLATPHDVIVIEGSGHSPMEDRPREFARVVSEFVR